MKKITSFLLLLFTSAGVTGAYAQNQSWLVDRSGWTVTAKNETALGLEGGASGPVAAMTDGNENSYWHSNWAGSQPGRELPQYFTVDLGQDMNLGENLFRTTGNVHSRNEKRINPYPALSHNPVLL